MRNPTGRATLSAPPQPDREPARFHVELPTGTDGKLPAAFCLLRSGSNRTHDGRGEFLFDDLAAASYRAAFSERGIADVMIDYDHGSLAVLTLDPAESAKAAGWFKPELRDGALWATDVEWTPRAAEKLRAREFRYYSPAVDWDQTADGTKRITKLINCAITNNPALAGITPLVAHATNPGTPPTKENRMKSLFKALGLSDTATEAEALVALNAVSEQVRSVVTLSGKASFGEALGIISGWKAGADQVAALSAKVAEMEKANATREIDSLIDEAKRDGRLAPAHEETARKVAAAGGSVALSAMLSVLPKLGAPRQEPADGQGQTPPAAEPTPEEKHVSSLLGLDPAKVAAFRAKKTQTAA